MRRIAAARGVIVGLLLSACGGGTEPSGRRVIVAEYALQTVEQDPLPHVVDAPTSGGTLDLRSGKIVLYSNRTFIEVADMHDTRDGGARTFSDTTRGLYFRRGAHLSDMAVEQPPGGATRIPGLFDGDALTLYRDNRIRLYQKLP